MIFFFIQSSRHTAVYIIPQGTPGFRGLSPRIIAPSMSRLGRMITHLSRHACGKHNADGRMDGMYQYSEASGELKIHELCLQSWGLNAWAWSEHESLSLVQGIDRTAPIAMCLELQSPPRQCCKPIRLDCIPPWKSGAFFATIPPCSWSMRQESLLLHEPLPVACSTRISFLQLAAPVPKLFVTRCLVVDHLDQAHAPTIRLLGACVIGSTRDDAFSERAA